MESRTKRLSGAEMLGRLLNLSGAPLDLCGVDMLHAARTAMNWRMGARLYAEIQAHGLEDALSLRTLAALRAAHLATIMRNRVSRRCAVDVLRALNSAGLQPMVLKGGVELLATPEGCECTRFMEDLDILIAPEDCPAAYTLLSNLGFLALHDYNLPPHHGPKLRDPKSGLTIEIHQQPILLHRSGFLAGLLADATPMAIGSGIEVLVPSPHYQILHNMIHAQESDRNFVFGVADLRQLFEFGEKCTRLGAAMDWSWLLHEAAELGLRPHLLSWIYASHRIFGLKLPKDLTFRLSERHQFRHIRNKEIRPYAFYITERFLLYHLLILDGVLSVRDIGNIYKHWAVRTLQLVLPQRMSQGYDVLWPRGRQRARSDGRHDQGSFNDIA